MHYCINLLHDGFLPALFGFLLWSLPGALGMYGLSIGVSNIGESLPRAAYALLSGLNAATVGIIVLAAVQLSEKAITDKMTRILVFLGASAGMMYNALWYFPLLMFLAGVATVIYDFRWLHGPIKVITVSFQKKAKNSQNTSEEGVEMQTQQQAITSNGHEECNAGAGPSSRSKDGEGSSQRIDENGTLPLTEQEASTAEDQSRIVSDSPSGTTSRHQLEVRNTAYSPLPAPYMAI